MRRPFVGRACLGILGIHLLGCGPTTKQVRLSIRPSLDMNDTRSCYVVARAVEEKAFGAESYDEVAARAMAPDDSVQRTLPVLPGRVQEITVPVPEKGRIAVYALLGRPEDERWRVLLPASPPAKVELRVDRGRLCWTSDRDVGGAQGRCATGPGDR